MDVGGLRQLAGVLSTLVRALVLVGLVAISFGPPYSYLAVRLVYGQRWAQTEAPEVLAVYTGYIMLLALNGVW
jgi:oligosaccharide translocation protein RFT1